MTRNNYRLFVQSAEGMKTMRNIKSSYLITHRKQVEVLSTLSLKQVVELLTNILLQ
jgi:hypothetical protein